MKANEARQRADEFNTSEANAAVSKALNAIETAVANGKYDVTIYERLPAPAVNMLEKDGFKVSEFSDPRGEDSTTISW